MTSQGGLTIVTAERQLHCQRVVASAGVLEEAVLTLRGPYIADIAVLPEGSELPAGAEQIAGWTIPGFVDTHVHGGGGADFATTDPAEALRGRDFHRRHGTTSSLASLVSADLDQLCAQIAMLAPLVEAGQFSGLHLEGPFLSPARCGAHKPSLLMSPEPAVIDRLLDAGRGTIAMITIAPELPGGLDAIEQIVGAGVVAAIGHTDGDAAVTARALDAGADIATHLFNAMRGIHHREPGPIPLLLSDERTVVELICDGFHLHRDVVAMAIAAAGPKRVALITDAMVAAGSPDGSYQLGGLEVSVVGGTARLVNPDGTPGAIAGSTLTMADAFAFVVDAGISIPDAAVMASSTPARRHHLDSVGEIRVGARADLCVVDERGRLTQVMHRGDWVERD